MLIASLFESNVLETIEEEVPGIVDVYFGRIVEPVVVVNSLCALMQAILIDNKGVLASIHISIVLILPLTIIQLATPLHWYNGYL